MVEILQHRAPVMNVEPTFLPLLRRPIFVLAESQFLELFIFAAIMANVAWIGAGHFYGSMQQETGAWMYLDYVFNWVFTVIFLIECLIKLGGLGWNQYIRNPWNKFDFAIVVISLFEIFEISIGFNVTIFRVFRVARIAKLVKQNPELKALLLTLVKSLPSLFNVGSLLCLMFFIFAVLGMNLYGDMPIGSKIDGDVFHEYNNFSDFWTAMITLFRCLTGEDWPMVMYALQNEGKNSAGAFFLIFSIIGNFMMLNLFIAVILENFGELLAAEDNADEEEFSTKDNKKYITQFMEAWMQLDVNATLQLPCYQIVKLLYSLRPPMGFYGLQGPLYEPNFTNIKELKRNAEFIVDYVTDLDLYLTETKEAYISHGNICTLLGV